MKIDAGIIVLFVFVLVACRNDIAEINSFTDTKNLPVQTSYNAEYLFTDNGKIANRLRAAQLDQYDGKEKFFEASGGFEITFFDTMQTEEARLTALRGWFYEEERKLIARDSVELFNNRGERLETSELIFLQDSGRIFTDKYVMITLANGSVIDGFGLESNDTFTNYRIKKNPGGEINLSDEDSL